MANAKVQIKRFFYKHIVKIILSIVLLVLIYWFIKNYFLIPYIDGNVIYLLLLIIAIIVLLSIIVPNNKQKFGIGELLTVASIFVVIFFFLYQDAANRFNKDITIDSVNYYNCRVSCDNIHFLDNLKDKSTKFTLSYFERDIYLKNLDFLYQKYKDKYRDFLKVVYMMGSDNRLLDMVLLMNTTYLSPELFSWRNQQILEITKLINHGLSCNCSDNNE